MLAPLFAILPLLAIASASPINKRQSGVLIESGRNSGQCLSILGGRIRNEANPIANDSPVVTLACTVATTWDISKGSGSIIATGTNYALDIGLTPSNNGGLKVWTSYPTAAQQTFYLTDDNRIAQTGGDQCLDQGDNGPQTYQCTTGNTNQVWNVRFNDPPPVALPTPVTPGFLSDIGTSSESVADPSTGGQRLRLTNRKDSVVMVADGYAAIGTPVMLFNAIGGGNNEKFQLFDLPNGTGLVKLRGDPNNLCLDAGDNPSNGSGVKVYTCGDNWPQQQWTLVNGQLRTANNQCLDVKSESTPVTYKKPYGSLRDLQTWECSTNQDPYMAFSVGA